MYCYDLYYFCFIAAGKENPECLSELQRSAKLSFDDQDYEKVEQICYMLYKLPAHQSLHQETMFIFTVPVRFLFNWIVPHNRSTTTTTAHV